MNRPNHDSSFLDSIEPPLDTSNNNKKDYLPKRDSSENGYPRPGPSLFNYLLPPIFTGAALLATLLGPFPLPVALSASSLEDGARVALSSSISELNSTATPKFQGVWIEEVSMCGFKLCRKYLASHNGHTPLPAASLTKLPTSLALLDRYGPGYAFKTKIFVRQPLTNRTASDLFVVSEGDPYFGGHQVEHLADEVRSQGVERITGGIYYNGPFTFDFSAGTWARRSFSRSLATYYLDLNYNKIGEVGWQNLFRQKPIVTFRGRTVVEILKAMNSYSNNFIADTSARVLGGGIIIEHTAEQQAGIPPGEIHLVNGSGLPPDQDSFGLNDSEHRNLMSPKAACDTLVAMKRSLRQRYMNINQILPIVRKDEGTLKWRNLPPDAVGKTGTLNDTSALAVLVPKSFTSSYCIAIINVTSDIAGARLWQERLINRVHDLK